MSNLEKVEERQSLVKELLPLAEILAPVANEEMLAAAIHNGADAVYIGMPGHNARARTEDFSFERLEKMIHEAHRYEVKVFIAFNILIFENELEALEHDLISILALKPDAIIVQDLGLAYLIRQLAPDQVLHASTQMTHTNSRGIELLSDLNLQRFVLGREVNMEEMASIRKNTQKELEVFVHGALCVAYSGQCLTSENFGGRSANRGQCAQSCRVSYDLIVDGKVDPRHVSSYLVSPKDLCGLDDIDQLIEIGINSFKIEGRYKSAEYVAMTTKSYREKISSTGKSPRLSDLEITYSRGFYSGWMHGVHHEKLVTGQNNSHRGALVGNVISTSNGKFPSLLIQSHENIFQGDGLLILDEKGNISATGKAFHVHEVKPQHYEIAFSNAVSLKAVSPHHDVYINSSDARDRLTKQTWSDKRNHKRLPISIKLILRINQPLILEVTHRQFKARFFSPSNCTLAEQRPLEKESLEREFSKLGGSIYKMASFELDSDSTLFLAAKELKQIRQTMIAWLDEQREAPNKEPFSFNKVYSTLLATPKPKEFTSPKPQLHLLIREPHQLKELDPNCVDRISLDYKHGVAYGPSLKIIQSLGCEAGIATTRILKENQERRLHDLNKHRPDFILVRNLGALQYLNNSDALKNIPRIGDFSLNISNHLSASYLIDKGLNLICPSYDLNKFQLIDLLQHSSPSRFEITVHQYMPSFPMKHCVFATFLSNGTNAKNCGLVCREHQVSLRDQHGVEHPLQADQECRNTMFHGKAQSAASLIPELMGLGVDHFRIEALNESAFDLAKKIELYRNVINKSISPDQLKQALSLDEKYGLSEGQLLVQRHYRDRKKS